MVAWLRLVLKDHPGAAGTCRARAQHILDGLAAAGHEAALRLQREMEALCRWQVGIEITFRQRAGSPPGYRGGEGQ